MKPVFVSEEFIDKHMVAANGEYVKIYLYMLRHADEDPGEERIAEALDIGKRTVRNAIAYLKSVGVDMYTLGTGEHTDNIELSGSSPDDSESAENSRDNSEYKELLYAVSMYLEKSLNPAELDSVKYMYDVLGLPAELIEYLVEICVQKNKKSLRYIEAIARDWHTHGILTVEAAKKDNELHAQEVGTVMKAFGISGRGPASEEMNYINRWFSGLGFSPEIVGEACARTIASTSSPNFKYADSILTKWADNNVKTLSDIEYLDAKHEAEKKSGKTSSSEMSANAVYEAVKREYDRILARDRDEQQQRIEEVYVKVPRIKELDEQIKDLGISRARAFISGGSESMDDYIAEVGRIREEKAQLLKNAGFGDDYMDIRYVCPDCRDTGFIGSRKCHCFKEKEQYVILKK